ncbi:hypothetical protein [Nocardioides gansuensis]|nr:hypothetical protein [Nocardioides gansuensis]
MSRVAASEWELFRVTAMVFSAFAGVVATPFDPRGLPGQVADLLGWDR